ncbi:MAG: metabolite traffic protein EboE [Cytophagaceae bacterium]
MTGKKGYHLTFCTNIFRGEDWSDVFSNLKNNIPSIRNKICKDKPFGLGLWISNKASVELARPDVMMDFKSWLEDNNCYVFTLNGFPYGDFHQDIIKDQVYAHDWFSEERYKYTIRLCNILKELLPEGMEGSISTLPISYKPWLQNHEDVDAQMRKACFFFSLLAEKLMQIKFQTGKLIYITIEPEPDGLIENSDEVIHFFNEWLIPFSRKHLSELLHISEVEAEAHIRNHIRVCYDICHFSIVFEKPSKVIDKFEKHKIKIGKIQISSALKVVWPEKENDLCDCVLSLNSINDPKYLHQVYTRNKDKKLIKYSDLSELLQNVPSDIKEARIHYHVPLFCSSYGMMQSTSEDILEVIEILKYRHITDHLEVETYTWEILPDDLKVSLCDSISRELTWVLDNFQINYDSLWIKQ